MAATTEEDGVDEMDDVCRTAAVAALILEARKRVAGCTTILWDDILMGFMYCIGSGRPYHMIWRRSRHGDGLWIFVIKESEGGLGADRPKNGLSSLAHAL